MRRDTKGIFKSAQEGEASNVPGLQAAYEPPQQPDLIVAGNREKPEAAARRVIEKLIEKQYLDDTSSKTDLGCE
jgi:bifunctional enzyme CysN/CysC